MATKDEIVRWHHRLNECEFEQTLGGNEGQGSLVCYSAWGCRVRHNLVTEQQQTLLTCLFFPLSVNSEFVLLATTFVLIIANLTPSL